MKSNLANIAKISFLSIIAFALLIFLTAEKPKSNISKLPQTIKIIDSANPVKADTVFTPNSIVAIANHDALPILAQLPNFVKLDKNFILIANISQAPWAIKEFVISEKLKNINKSNKTTFVFDDEGSISTFFKHSNHDKKYYAIYFIDSKLAITKISDGNVEDGDFDKNLTKEQIFQKISHSLNDISKL